VDRDLFDKNLRVGTLAAALAIAVFALTFFAAIIYIG
jgi:hypothetical protein